MRFSVTFAKFLRISILLSTSGPLFLLVGKNLFEVNNQEQHSWKLFHGSYSWLLNLNSHYPSQLLELNIQKIPPNLDKLHKTIKITFRKRSESLLNVICTFNSRPVPRGYSESYPKTFWSNVKTTCQASKSNIFHVNKIVV